MIVIRSDNYDFRNLLRLISNLTDYITNNKCYNNLILAL